MKLWGSLKLIQRPYHYHRLSKSIVNTYATRLSTKCFSLPFYSCGPLYTMHHNQTRVRMRFWSVMVFSVLYYTHLSVGLMRNLVEHQNIFHYMPCRTPCTFVHPMISLRPSSSGVKWSGMVSAFSTNESMGHGPKLCVKCPSIPSLFSTPCEPIP